MNKKMKDKLIEILRFLIALAENPEKTAIPKLKSYIDILEEIAVHEDDCFTNLPDNMMFGSRGERYLHNTSELTGAASLVKQIIEQLEGDDKKGLVEKIQKARYSVKHCIDR